MSALLAAEMVPIPSSHLDLLAGPICGVLTTMGSDGQPQSSLVWVDHDDQCARINTTLERRKGRNMLDNPKVSLLVVDPADTGRFIQIRGEAELVTDGALEHLDELTPTITKGSVNRPILSPLPTSRFRSMRTLPITVDRSEPSSGSPCTSGPGSSPPRKRRRCPRPSARSGMSTAAA